MYLSFKNVDKSTFAFLKCKNKSIIGPIIPLCGMPECRVLGNLKPPRGIQNKGHIRNGK